MPGFRAFARITVGAILTKITPHSIVGHVLCHPADSNDLEQCLPRGPASSAHLAVSFVRKRSLAGGRYAAMGPQAQ